VEFASGLVELEQNFEDLEINLLDSGIDLMDFAGLEVNFVDLRMNFLDLKICFGDLGIDSERGFVGLETDLVDGRRLGYFRDWYFGQVVGQRRMICYLADLRE